MTEGPAESVLETIGDTPLVRVQAAPDEVPVYAKLESFNPGASVKDRIGAYICERLLERGDLEPGGTVVEPTAGNTGIGLAIAANQLDLEAVFVVPERFSVEKQTLMRALGAEVVNTPTEDAMGGAIERAHEIAAGREMLIGLRDEPCNDVEPRRAAVERAHGLIRVLARQRSEPR